MSTALVLIIFGHTCETPSCFNSKTAEFLLPPYMKITHTDMLISSCTIYCTQFRASSYDSLHKYSICSYDCRNLSVQLCTCLLQMVHIFFQYRRKVQHIWDFFCVLKKKNLQFVDKTKLLVIDYLLTITFFDQVNN